MAPFTPATGIYGISDELEVRLRKLCKAKGWEVNDVLGTRAGSPAVQLQYERTPGGDRTSWLPSGRHMDYAHKGWLAVDMREA